MIRNDLAEAARYELGTREVHYPQQVANGTRSADDAGRSIAAWRAIVALLEYGSTEFEPILGATPAAAWPALLDAVQLALNHRAAKGDADRTRALREIRSALIRSAIRQGAEIGSSDEPRRKALAA